MKSVSFDAEEKDPYDGLPRVTSIVGMLNFGDKDQFLKDWAGQCAIESCFSDILWEEINASPDVIKELIRKHKKAWRSKLSEAATIGTLAHKMIECVVCMRMLQTGAWSTGRSVPTMRDPSSYDDAVYESASRAFVGWQKWLTECGQDFEPIFSEEKIRSVKVGLGGTIDCIAKFRGGTWIVDWKTSNRIDKKKFALQGMAYKILAETELGIKIDGIEIVRCDKNVQRGKFETMTIDDKEDFAALKKIFDRLLEIHQILKG